MTDSEEMSDSEMWAQHREDRQKKRWSNRDQSLNLLSRLNISVAVLNEKTGHYRVGRFDFWPTTGKFYCQKTGEEGRGVRNLINKLSTGK